MNSAAPFVFAIGKGSSPRVAPGPFSLDPNAPYFLSRGELWFYRGLTSFLLLKRALSDDWDAVRAWFDVAHACEANALRLWSQVNWRMGNDLGVEEGFLASDYSPAFYDQRLHDLLNEAAKAGFALEMVGHTFAYDMDEMVEHCARVDGIVSQHDNGLYEQANEPSVNGIDIVTLCERYSPETRIASSGHCAPTPYPGFDYATDHPPRDNESCRKFRGAIEPWDGSGPYQPFQPPWKFPWVFDEPGRIEDATCWPSLDDIRAWGAGCHLFSGGTLIHGGHWAQGCHPEMITGDMRARIQAHNAGWNDVPEQRYYGYKHPPENGALRRYQRHDASGQWWEISVRPYAFGKV